MCDSAGRTFLGVAQLTDLSGAVASRPTHINDTWASTKLEMTDRVAFLHNDSKESSGPASVKDSAHVLPAVPLQ